MADIDPNLIGSVINALPMDRMIGGPLQAMVNAQIQASRSYADFLMQVCFEQVEAKEAKEKALFLSRNIQFEYDETLVDDQGELAGVYRKTMRIPLIAAITHPNICIEEGSVDFELEVTQSMEEKSQTEAEGGFEAKLGWGPFSVSVHGKVSHKDEQTRKTDTRAKYSIHTAIKRQDPPEALCRVIDFLTDASTKPTLLTAGKDKKFKDTKTLPADTDASKDFSVEKKKKSE